jgi:hypothetical protein
MCSKPCDRVTSKGLSKESLRRGIVAHNHASPVVASITSRLRPLVLGPIRAATRNGNAGDARRAGTEAGRSSKESSFTPGPSAR